jgi:glucose-1-phosphate thymidylyltransferase
VFRAGTVVGHDEDVIVGLPDTVWFPKAALQALPDADLSFLLFPVERPEFFDAVVLDGDSVRMIQVKQPNPSSRWIWGSFKMSAAGFRQLHELWRARERRDEYFGTLVNAYIDAGGLGIGVKAGESYVDVGTIDGYRTAMALLAESSSADGRSRMRAGPSTDRVRPMPAIDNGATA